MRALRASDHAMRHDPGDPLPAECSGRRPPSDSSASPRRPLLLAYRVRLVERRREPNCCGPRMPNKVALGIVHAHRADAAETVGLRSPATRLDHCRVLTWVGRALRPPLLHERGCAGPACPRKEADACMRSRRHAHRPAQNSGTLRRCSRVVSSGRDWPSQTSCCS
jgi:hypothetical protein